ncbi:MAG: phage portal protein [Oscillospiraceae bacterium]|jgi:hypothetical protein|nr:phage portal protein [Oscillospiraceae bacterium]
MSILKKKKTDDDGQVIIQTARPADPYGDYYGFSDLGFENTLYEALRERVPVIDAAISKIIRLTGGFRIITENEHYQDIMDDFCENVAVGYSGKGLSTFTDTYLDSLITYGNAVGEMLIDNETLKFGGLYNAKSSDIEIIKGNNPLEKIFYKRIENKRYAILYPERILFTPLNPQSGQVYGRSVLRGLPCLSKILLKIYQCIGQNYERTGNVRYAVTYKPPADGSERMFTKDRAKQIAEEWSAGMRASQGGEIRDFIATGDVDIKVIGADNKLLDTQVPVRQILEQLLSKLSVPPFLVGMNWSTTERMSSQQTDILTSELEYYRRQLAPVIKETAKTFLHSEGLKTALRIEWNTINLQDELQLAEARLKNAQALKIETELQNATGLELETVDGKIELQ